MAEKSLTAKSAKNSVVALLFYAINLILQFISRKIFIEYLGEDILGLNTTVSSILQFLNIAELGIGSAIGYTLYKPLHDNDRTAINEIVALQGWLYKRIAAFIIIGSVVLMAFFPVIFAKTDLPLWYSYGTYTVLLFSSLLGYFINFRQIVLSADQKEYKIQYSYKSVLLAKLIFQIVFIRLFDNGYLWWLILEVAFAVIASISLNVVIGRTYPYLATPELAGKELIARHPAVLTKTKQLFFHKIGGLVLTKTSPIVIYAYATLETVAIYGNYMLIVSGVTSLITAIFTSMNAGVGNLVAGGNKDRIMRVFNELFSIRFLITGIICFCVYNFTQPFMRLWMGPELLLDNDILIIFVLITFVNLNRLTGDAFINAYGLFSDIWSPIVEASINIGLSVLLGYFWGLKGIMIGVLASLLVVIFGWKQFFLFRKGFKRPFRECVFLYLQHFAILGISYPVIKYIYIRIMPAEITGALSWILHASVYAFIAVAVLGIMLWIFTSGMKSFVNRMSSILIRYIRK